jgi:DnaJ-class molecular chaperone
MQQKDYYKILGVEKNASSEDILKRHTTDLAHQYHPDKKGGDEKKVKEINEAYQVLSDKENVQIMIDLEVLLLMVMLVVLISEYEMGRFMDDFGGIEDIFDIFGGRSRKKNHKTQGREKILILSRT